MRTSLVSWPLRRAARTRQRVALRAARAREDGFILLESLIAITLITVVMGAVGTEYVSGLASTSRQRATQAAAQLADSNLEQVRALNPSDLVTGRGSTSVATEFGSAPSAVAPWLVSTSMDQAYDSSAAANSGTTTATTIFPTLGVAQTLGTTTYTVTDYFGWCYLLTAGSSTTCVQDALAPAGTQFIRTVVAVTWSASTCPSTGCAYVTSTVISSATDPTFKINQPLPAAPAVTNPGTQTVAVGDVVNLQLAVTSSTGVPPFVWSSTASLPTGLSISPAGLISGTVGGSSGTVSSTVSVLDAYNRAATASFSWTVKPALVGTSPGAQASTTATAVNLTLSATGGTGSPYTWADPNRTLPPGLGISSAGTITGTPTTVGNYSVSVVVTDASGTRTAQDTFTWTVTYPPIAASNPGTQTATVGTPISPSLQLSGSGGSGNYAWSDPSGTLPAGLTLTSAGLITGSPTTTQSYTVNLTLRDPVTGYTTTTGNFTWSVVAKPTVSTPATQSSTVGAAVNLSVATTCLNSPCTYVLTNGPAGLSATSTGITGTVTGSTATFTPTIKVTDADGASTTSAAFTWNVYSAPSLSGLATNTATETGTENVPITYTCPRTSCTITLSGTIPGLGLGTSATTANNTTLSLVVSATNGTVYLSGTVQGSAVTTGTSKAYTPSLSITDGGSFTPTASSATWTAYTVPTWTTPPAAKSVTRNTAVNQTISYTCPVASCTISLVTGFLPPTGVGLATSGQTTPVSTTSLNVTATSGTVNITGKVASSDATGGYPVKVSITDANNVAVTSTSGTWTVS